MAMAGVDYEVIVSDYQMPGMNGIEFLKRLRSQLGHIPFILFTGRGREEVAIEALNCGADFYLQKGGDPFRQVRSAEKSDTATGEEQGDREVADHQPAEVCRPGGGGKRRRHETRSRYDDNLREPLRAEAAWLGKRSQWNKFR